VTSGGKIFLRTKAGLKEKGKKLGYEGAQNVRVIKYLHDIFGPVCTYRRELPAKRPAPKKNTEQFVLERHACV
jgi:hypothetical protein